MLLFVCGFEARTEAAQKAENWETDNSNQLLDSPTPFFVLVLRSAYNVDSLPPGDDFPLKFEIHQNNVYKLSSYLKKSLHLHYKDYPVNTV
jgi:hypothetical protein